MHPGLLRFLTIIHGSERRAALPNSLESFYLSLGDDFYEQHGDPPLLMPSVVDDDWRCVVCTSGRWRPRLIRMPCEVPPSV